MTRCLQSVIEHCGQALGTCVVSCLSCAQVQGGEDDGSGEQQGKGIVLRRKKRDDSSPTKAGDALALADMVQKLCQVSCCFLTSSLTSKSATLQG